MSSPLTSETTLRARVSPARGAPLHAKQRLELVEQRRIGRQVRFEEAPRRFVPGGRSQHTLTRERAAYDGIGDEDRAMRGMEQNRNRRLCAETGNGEQRGPQRREWRPAETIEATAVLGDEPPRERLEAPGRRAIHAGGPEHPAEPKLADTVEGASRQEPLATECGDGAHRVRRHRLRAEHDADGDLEGRAAGPRSLGTEPVGQRSIDAQEARLDGIARRPGNPAPAREHGGR